ncbi:MAG: hypothetical protein WD988_01225 [Candidatus Curtissbacteria bacterium]
MQTALIFFGELIFLFFLSKVLISDLGRLIFGLTRSSRVTVYLLAFLFLPGTAIHEMAHVLAAALLRVPVGDIDLMPKADGKRVKLGSVPVGDCDPIRMFIIGAAPALLGTILIIFALLLLGRLGFLDIWWGKLLGGYIVFEIGNTMFSSQRDMEGAIEFLAAVTLILGLLYFVGVRTGEVNFSFLAETLAPVFTLGSRFLVVPIIINIGVILIAKILNRLFKKTRR